MAAAAPGSSSIALTRLTEERKQWRKDHPFGFYARPVTSPDGSLNMYQWECGVPGKDGGLWEGGVYRVIITFSGQYPAQCPKVVFTPPLPHPNIFNSGAVCLSILSYDWKPTIGVKQILLGVQALLDEPNPKSPANHDAYMLYKSNRKRYEETVRAFAAKFATTEGNSDGASVVAIL